MKVLVTYASKHGSTAEIADAIAGRLRSHGLAVDTIPVSQEPAVEGYDAAVIGSAVYMGAWMKPAVSFLERSSEALSRIPIWLFSSGPITGTDRDALSGKQTNALEAANPRGHHVFGGVVDLSKLGFVEKRIVKMVKAPEGDRRDWADVDAFADEIAQALSTAVG
jgi:menaquinone-dependent protoporphyrinogen oxidase